MAWLLLVLGFFLLLSGILGQVYSLKTKRGVVHPRTRIWRLLTRLALVLAGLLLIGMAVNRIVLHRGLTLQANSSIAAIRDGHP